ncbi:MAG: hypothetical protein ACKPKO_11885, partial [Candidatus Fonsibacter sp.]
SGCTYIRPTAPSVKGIYLGQASTTSYGIEMTAPDDTTIDFSTPGTNYKGRIQYHNSTNALSFFTNSSATASMVITDSVTVSNLITTGNITANTIISRIWEPLVGFIDVQIKADQVYFGNPVWLTATSLSAKFWSPVYVDQGIKIHN